MVGHFLARLEVDGVSSTAGCRDRSYAESVDVVLCLEFRVVVHSGCDGVGVQGRRLWHFLAGLKVDGVAGAFACRNRRYAECVDIVLCLELRVVVNGGCDGVGVQRRRLRHLLAGCQGDRVSSTF